MNNGELYVTNIMTPSWISTIGGSLIDDFIGERDVLMIVGRDKFYYAVVTRFGLRYIPVYSLEGNNVCQL